MKRADYTSEERVCLIARLLSQHVSLSSLDENRLLFLKDLLNRIEVSLPTVEQELGHDLDRTSKNVKNMLLAFNNLVRSALFDKKLAIAQQGEDFADENDEKKIDVDPLVEMLTIDKLSQDNEDNVLQFLVHLLKAGNPLVAEVTCHQNIIKRI